MWLLNQLLIKRVCAFARLVRQVLCFVLVVLSYDGYAETDVRLVIDVSGSMKQNDPKNLREPAVDLLVRLLPDGSRAGVWTFGKYVNMLVPYQTVDDAWREMAKSKAAQINSVGLFTNIGEALERAAHDRKKTGNAKDTHVILLTDGMVDVDKNPELNQKEWLRIADKVLPELKAGGYTVHTIALSENADRELLEKMAVATDGVAAVAQSAEDLMSVFLKAFDAAAPAEQVPLKGNSFVVDSSVEEFTALVFRENANEETKLLSPDKKVYSASNSDADVAWYRSSSYDLITAKQPLEGEWTVQADLKPNSRITVVSDLNLRVKSLPNNVFRGESLNLSFLLQEDGKTLKNESFLSLLTSEASLNHHTHSTSSKTPSATVVWQHGFDQVSLPKEGIFKADLPALDKIGDYTLKLMVDGKTFQRHFEHTVKVLKPFMASVAADSGETDTRQYRITVVSHGDPADVQTVQVLATITKPNRRKGIKPLSINERGAWSAVFVVDTAGEYRVDVKVKGEHFEYQLEPILIQFDPDKAFISEVGTQPEAELPVGPKVEALPETTAEPKPVTPVVEAPSEAEVLSDDAEALPVEAAPPGLPSWLIYTLLGVGNLLLLGLGFVVFRKIMSGLSDDTSDETPTESSQEPPQTEAKPSAEPELEPEPEPEPSEQIDMEQTEFAMDTAEDEEEEPPMEDLEAPAEVDLSEEVDLDATEDIEFDEEMLNAEGLDLAEDEVDESIANLLDELDGRQKQG